MRAVFNLPFDQIFKGRKVDLTVFERGYQCGNRAVKHLFVSLLSKIMVANLSCMGRFGKVISTLAVLFMAFPVQAIDSPVNRLQSNDAKRYTIAALADYKNGNKEAARQKFAQAKDPLAAKIYHWLILSDKEEKDLNKQLFIRLSHFIRQNPEWPDISKMRARAEESMPEDLPNSEVLAWYEDFPPETVYGMGRFMDALMIEGQREKARALMVEWWSQKLTSRDQQVEIFKKYGSLLTLEAHKRRFDNLLFNKQYENARAIADLLGQGYPALAEARIALAQQESNGVSGLIDAVPVYLEDDPGLLYERLQWRRKRDLDKGALEILRKKIDAEKVSNPKDWWAERHIMIRRLLDKADYDSAYELASQHIQTDGFTYAQAQWLAGWLALRFVNKPTDAYERFSALYPKVSTPVSRARAAYWAGRAADALDQDKLAQDWYQKAADFQTVFYGQLAAVHLSNRARKDILDEKNIPQISTSEKKNFEKNELVQASELFRKVGMKKRSEDFLFAFLKQQETSRAYRFAAELAGQHTDFSTTIKIAKKATEDGLFLTKESYPTITKHLQGINSPEWALIHAVIRQESVFDPEAKSHAGALGLMQLLPTTAQEVSARLKLQYQKSWLTSKPKYNIQLGSAYLSRLLAAYDGDYAMAIAAYNAGPGRVREWINTYGDPRIGDIDLIDWIELIPIYETRNYVQRVMEGTYVYRYRLEGIQNEPKSNLHLVSYKP
ncbi:MAG: transglycosylase SLT domain-containing protein [Alphaproteobacteria bacterium]|nr:transglycosylase SLT domain-containing protein [Alphaproteobacteria bacterium]